MDVYRRFKDPEQEQELTVSLMGPLAKKMGTFKFNRDRKKQESQQNQIMTSDMMQKQQMMMMNMMMMQQQKMIQQPTQAIRRFHPYEDSERERLK